MAKTVKSYLSVWARQSRNWRILSIRALFHRFFQRLTMAYTSIYIRELGANPIQLGVVNSFNQVAGTLISIPVGWLEDRFSLRKIFLIGVGLAQLVTLIYALATDWIMIVPAMVLSAFAMKIGVCLTICDVSLKDEDRGTCKGICDGLFNGPSLLAPTLAAVLITFAGGISVRGIRPLFWIQLIAGTVLFVFVATQLKEIVRPRATRQFRLREGYREVFRRGNALKRFIVFSVVNTVMMNMVTPFTYPFAREIQNANPFILGWMSTAGLVVQIVLAAPFGRIADRIGGRRVIYMTEPLYWMSVLILVFAPAPEFLIISSTLGGFRMIANYVAMTPLRVERVPIDCIGRWRGILGLFGGLVSIPAPIIGGIIWDTVGPHALLLIPLVMSLLIKIPLLSTLPKKRKMLRVPDAKS
ncbi:MAG: MFS transporter [Candidatus Bathyarchaeota archaeon]|nr:MAG: MFS transporter [Candidatus Bathyarchaeota archaeon]